MTIVIGDFSGKGGRVEEGICLPTFPIKKAIRIEWLLLNMLPLNLPQTLNAHISYFRSMYH